MVLDNRGHDNVVTREAKSIRQVVDGLGGVAAQDGYVVVAAIRKPHDCFTRMLVGLRCDLRFVPRTAMNTRIPRQELGDSIGHSRQRASRRSAIKREVPTLDAIDALQRKATEQRNALVYGMLGYIGGERCR